MTNEERITKIKKCMELGIAIPHDDVKFLIDLVEKLDAGARKLEWNNGQLAYKAEKYLNIVASIKKVLEND